MCNWDVFYLAGQWKSFRIFHILKGQGFFMSLSLLSMGQCKTQKAAAKTCVMLSRYPCVLSAVICLCTASPASSVDSYIYHIRMSVSYLFSVNVLCVKDIWPGQSDCFLFKSNVNGNFRECTCILNVSSDKNTPTLDDPWRLFRKKGEWKEFTYFFQIQV